MNNANYAQRAPFMALTLMGACLLSSCNGPPGPKPPPKPEDETAAKAFVSEVNKDLVGLAREGNAAGWTQQTYITADTQYINSMVTEKYLEYFSRKAGEAKAWDKAQIDPSTARSLTLIKLGVSAPAPADPAKRAELAGLSTELDAMYGEGKYCPPGTNKDGKKTDCKIFDELADTIATSRNYQDLTDAWAGWHTISKPMRPKYQRFVELANEALANWVTTTSGCCGVRGTTCRQRISRRKPRASTARWSRSTRTCTATRASGCNSAMARKRWPTASRFRRTCWATCGRSSGTACTTTC
jgi:hypothetical protein